MAKFVYRMQNILDLKSKLEIQKKMELGIANAKLHEEEEKLQELMLRRAGYERKAKELVSGTINIQHIRTCKHAIDAMKSAVRSQMITVHVAEKNVELVRNQLSELMIERKTYEKLREKAFEQFKAEVAYEESRAVDELVSYNFHKD